MNDRSDNVETESTLHSKLSRASGEPGVYVMKGADDNVIYIGKARNLKKRLTAYFKNSRHTDMKTGVLVTKIADFETVITRTEKEPLDIPAEVFSFGQLQFAQALGDFQSLADKGRLVIQLDIGTNYQQSLSTLLRLIKQVTTLSSSPWWNKAQ